MKRRHRTLFEVLLRVFPAPFRDRFGDGMRDAFGAAYREHSQAGGGRLVAFLWRTTVNMLGSGFRERARPTQDRPAGRWGGGLVSWLDVKLGLRMLVKNPGLTAVAVFALAIGIPVGMAPTQVVNAIEAPLPVDEGERIQMLRHWNVATRLSEATTSYEFMQWSRELTSFEALGALRMSSYNVMSEDGLVPPVRGAEVTASTFDILRVKPLLGRTLRISDEEIGAQAVVVIGHRLWQARLGGDLDIVGRSVRIGRVPHVVVGVMPEDFLFPISHQLWLPLRERFADEPGQGAPLAIFGRLADGTSPDHAQTELSTVGRRLALEFPNAYDRVQPEVTPFSSIILNASKGGIRAEPGFYLIQLLALLLLVVACSNVGMLIFARTATRSSELAVRTALGASRARIVAQVFTESLVLAVSAAGVGLLILQWVPGRLLSVVPGELPYWIDTGVTRGTVLWTISLAVVSAAVAGVVPALMVTGKAIQKSIRAGKAGRSGIRFGGLSSALIIADVALAVAVVGFAVGLAEHSLWTANADDAIGIQAEQYLSVQLRLPQTESASGGDPSDPSEFTLRVAETQRALIQRLRAEPGIRGVAMATSLPRMQHRSGRVDVEGEINADGFRGHRVRTARVDLDFFTALEAPILNGRAFVTNDLGRDGSAVIVNTTFVEHILGGMNPIGRRVRYSRSASGEPGPWYQIVGVVDQLGMKMVDPDSDEGMYHPMAYGERNPVRIAIHVGSDPASITPRVRALANEVDPTAVIEDPAVLNQVYEGDWYILVGMALGFTVLVGVLLMLAASGIYAIMSFTVAERTREIGIRAALGAQRSSIAMDVARRALVQIGVGVLIGTPVAWRVFVEMADEGSGGSAVLLALVPGVSVMILVGLFACTGPTLRALRITPTEALQE